jgi:tetraacyldisaccharide 4'-kinase
MQPTEFRDLVSGRRRGPRAALLRAALRLVEWPYTWAVCWRNRRYDRGAIPAARIEVPAVSVGNLTLGGTGKTPMVEWIARWLLDRGVPPAIVSRGYRAAAGGANDEAMELALKLPGVPHVQNPDRVAAARQAIAQTHCRAIVLDDAFQHRRIARDLDIVLLDALEPLGFDHVFPRGTLREPASGLRRAHVVALSPAGMLPPDARGAIRRRAAELAPDALWMEVRHAPRALVSATAGECPLDWLRNKSVAAFCGLGNPAGFRHTLAGCGCRLAGFREFPDHHAYPQEDVRSLAAWADELAVDAVLCTQKDLVKLGTERLGSRPLWAVSIGMEILRGQEEFESRLRGLVGRICNPSRS